MDTASSTVTSADDGLKTLNDRAAAALRPGATVAFFPPDQCRDISAATTNATKEAAEMANNCGVLLSALENSVADRYKVVSWQTLKGTDPFERAATRNVDIIFEVDSFGMNSLGEEASSAGSISFYDQPTESERQPLMLGPDELAPIGQRCKAWADEIDSERTNAGMVGSFTGAIKAVEVSTGQALLYYQRTLTDDPGAESNKGYDLYFRSNGSVDYVPPNIQAPDYNALQKGGVAATAVGATMFVIGTALRAGVFRGTDEDNDGNKEFRQPGTGGSAAAATAGFLLLGGGITMLVFGNRRAKKTVPAPITNKIPPPTYETPLEVLCRVPVTPPWLAEAPKAAAPETQGGTSYSFSETKTTGRDHARERENRLRKNMLDDFTSALGGLGEQ